MERLAARVECMKLAATAVARGETFAQDVAKVATALYDWCVDGETGVATSPANVSGASVSPSTSAKRKDKAKAP